MVKLELYIQGVSKAIYSLLGLTGKWWKQVLLLTTIAYIRGYNELSRNTDSF